MGSLLLNSYLRANVKRRENQSMKKSLPILAGAGLVLTAVLPVIAQEGPINVISREDGSGTRSAFVEIVGVVDENDDDMTALSAVVQNSTNGVMQTVAGDSNAIGYISLGSLDDTVKAVNIEGVEPTADTIKAGDYKIARPFNLAWAKDEELSEVAADFLDYIYSAEGQAIVEEEGFISVTRSADEGDEGEEASEESAELPSYEASGLSGTIEVVGSTSVTPIIERLAEEYKALNSDVTINITSNGSSAGLEAARTGTGDLGMASRELSDEEKEALNFDAIAMDGIAVIVHNENATEDLTLEQVRQIFLGEIVNWEDLAN